MITADQLVAHAIGDYLLQSDWMASGKTRRFLPAAAHALTYSLPFIALRPTLGGWLVIVGTHLILDRWRLARYLCWAGGLLSPPPYRSWGECKETGFPPEREPWMRAWLLIIADNTLHVLINSWSLRNSGTRTMSD
jgi:hypothetical protein